MYSQTSAEGEKEKGPAGLLTCLRESVALQPYFFGSGLLAQISLLSAKRRLKHIQRILDSRIGSIIQQDPKSGFAAKYIGPNPCTPALLQECIDQFKTLILAGQDTTSCALQCEHDRIIGRERQHASAQPHKESRLLQRLPYTTAVIKETLRLRGISGTTHKPTKDMIIDVDNEPVPLEAGPICYVNNFILMRNPEDAEDFRPSRSLQDDENNRGNGHGEEDQRPCWMRPIAYSPFERGPRNCVGQEVTTLEMHVVLVLTVCCFGFEKEGYDGDREEEVYDISRVVHSPVDRMKMRFMERPGV
ncbi:AflN protein [Colletotrichum somersetense]|nr:AflN protein [Colletotrichum somersetense]